MSKLEKVSQMAAEFSNGEQQLVQAVSEAKSAGHSWSEIGEALGVSRQAAWERFNNRITTP